MFRHHVGDLEPELPIRCIFLSTQLSLTNRNLPDYLRRAGLAGAGEAIDVEEAGDGNINWVRRARLAGGRSYVVKQARPALEKFPEYEVSTERLVFEARYLERVRPFDSENLCPKVHRFDEPQRVLVMEDLGQSIRLDQALASGRRVGGEMAVVARFLGRVHRATADDPDLASEFPNDAMRRLHGDHIFALPYREAFPAPPKTTALGERVRKDAELIEIAEKAYASYLRPTGPLVHADVQPGNLLLAAAGPKLLDAEIAHAGDPAFDMGTLIAHLALPAAARDKLDGANELLGTTWNAYALEHGARGIASREDVLRYAGLELTRRTIGAARVPFVEDDEAGVRVLELGMAWTRHPDRAVDRLGAR